LADSRKELAHIASEAKKFLEEKFYIYTTVAVSDMHSSLTGIPEAYNEALEAMQYKMIIGDNSIICYEDIKNPHRNYEYSMDSEYQLINYIKIGDSEKANEILDTVFESNFSNEAMSIQLARCLLFDLISTMIKALNSINAVNRPIAL
jgi:hypothetical protein